MEQKIERKKRGWLITAVSLMVFSVCVTASLAVALMHNDRAQKIIENTYEQNLYDFNDNLNNIEVNLSKLMVAPDGKYAMSLLTDVYSEAQAASKALDNLPVFWHDTEETEGVLNRIADFATSYQVALLAGKSGRSFNDNVENMYVAVRRINAEISDSVRLVSQNKLDIRKITAEKPYGYRKNEKTIQHKAVDYPEMIYDGPFSDGRADDVYRLLEGTESITLQQAKDIAAAALPELQVKAVNSLGKTTGEPLYELSVQGEKGDAYVCISERGGKIVSMSVSRPLGAVMLGEASATACAKEYAAKLGYATEPVWYLPTGGVAYVNLAPVQDGVVLYPDLVKVKVALDNGEILGLEAKNYCLNHTERDVKLTMNRAAVPQMVDKRLEVTGVRGAVIPMANGKERLCYEAICEYKGIEYFIYLDAANGETVKIMRTVDSEQGKMVM